MRVLVMAVLASGLVTGHPRAAETINPWQTLELVRAANPPVRNLVELRARILDPPGQGQSIPQPTDGHMLWINDIAQRTYHLVPVKLAHTTDHAEWFVEQGREAGDLRAAAAVFEAQIFPRVQELTGLNWTPGSSGQRPLGIFIGGTRGVAGYMSAVDSVPRSVFPYSNERLMVYLSDSLRPGSGAFNATLAHELEHVAHFVINPTQEGWFDEGVAELVSNLVTGASAYPLTRFRQQSDVQLTAWSEKPWEARAHYEASYLWARYLMERGGGAGSLADLLRSGGRGLATADRFVRMRDLSGGVEDIFRDWLVANLVDDPGHGDGRFGYQGLDHRSAVTGSVGLESGVAKGDVHQFAANYYELEVSEPVELHVEVALTVPLIAAEDTRGGIFWSLRGDSLDTRLTRRFDLSGVERATLRYRVWHDLEPDYDVCYTLGSSDGATWLALLGRWMIDHDHLGPLLGPAYSGRSGDSPLWLEDEVDLSPFTGGQAYVRFECVTDQGYSAAGLALDDLAIPEIGFSDGAESDQGWTGEGFVRAANLMAQPAAVLVVEMGDGWLSVRDVPLDAAGRGRFPLRGSADGPRAAWAIVTGLAPATLEKMQYRLWVTPTEP